MDKKILKWNFIFQYGYVLTNIINSFVLLPFYVLYIDDVQLGLWWATGNILAWLTLSDPGIGDVLQQKIAELSGKGNVEEISKTIGSGLISALLTFILSLVIGVLFFLFLEDFLNFDLDKYSNLKWAFLVSVLSTGITLVTFALAGINQGLLRSKHVALSYISSNILFFIVNLALLILGFGLMSIAIAAVVRAVFLTAYNLIIIFRSSKRESIGIIFNMTHFKKFLRIFSFTSVSKIVTSFSNSIDLIILARYIPPQAITLFEINRRPIKMLQSLLGRYSVALMPGISFGVGKDQEEVKKLILKQFRYFLLLILVFTGLSLLCYEQLISLWISASKYGGNSMIILMVINFFFALIGYFISNVTYAIGDIKVYSVVTGIKGVLLLACIPVVAAYSGIIGVLWTTLITTFLFDFIFFVIRLNKLGYFAVSRQQLKDWTSYLIVLVLSFSITFWSIKLLGVSNIFMLAIYKVLFFVTLFLLGLLVIDKKIKKRFFQYLRR